MRSLRKKGDIELGKIVTFIIVAVVLIVVVAFFLGGTTGVTKAIKRVFFGVTAGTDLTLAVENCRQYCEQAKILQTPEQKKGSAYCKWTERIDKDHDGEADKKGDKYIEWYCPLGDDKDDMGMKYLDVPCDLGVDEKKQPITCA